MRRNEFNDSWHIVCHRPWILSCSCPQARQRSSCASRTGPGKFYRLYAETAYKMRCCRIQFLISSGQILPLDPAAEIYGFDFLDPPPAQTMLTALESLQVLSPLNSDAAWKEDAPTHGEDGDCVSRIRLFRGNIVAILSFQSVFFGSKDKQGETDSKKDIT